jgi:hypothetical protein
MIEIITKYSIFDILQNPEQYINEFADILLLKAHQDAQCIIMMIGYDIDKNSYYFVLEDDDVSEDYYCKKENLRQTFIELVSKAIDGSIY